MRVRIERRKTAIARLMDDLREKERGSVKREVKKIEITFSERASTV